MFRSSAMRSIVESGVFYGRPYSGVAVLVNKNLQYCTEILCPAERFIVLLIINVYFPSSGTIDILSEISDWLNKYSNQSNLLAVIA